MKRLTFLSISLLILFILFPIGLVCAQTPAKLSRTQAPITYPGDTAETIRRRAQWIEGAKKEEALNWWCPINPTAAKKVVAEFNKIYPFVKVDYWR